MVPIRGSFRPLASKGVAIAWLGVCAPAAVFAQADPQACRSIADDRERLGCYDRWSQTADRSPAAQGGHSPAVVPAAPAPVPAVPLAAAENAAGTVSVLSHFWELDDADKRGTFRVAGYKPNIFLPVHQTTRINRHPSSPALGHEGDLEDYHRLETKLQISLRTKLLEDFALPGGDVWFGYTQQSLWQLYNHKESAPFRSTDYEPELIYVLPVPASLGSLPGDWRFSMLQAGIAHQSNGQALPLSRSWNRVYLAGGFEHGDVSVLGHVWHRLHESADDDDNPDLTDYRGRGDLQVVWPIGKASASVLWRTNFRNWDRGALQVDLSYPVNSQRPDGLRWYLQLFTGYGETLLDYNFRQTSVGLGLTLFDF